MKSGGSGNSDLGSNARLSLTCMMELAYHGIVLISIPNILGYVQLKMIRFCWIWG